MAGMTKIRERSQYVLGAFLLIFILSMTVGGLVGGANVVDLVISKFYSIVGKEHQLHLSRYAGKIGDVWIERQEFENERARQIAIQRNRSGQDLDSRAILNAENAAWNAVIENKIKDKLITEMGLKPSAEEIYEYLLLMPPPSLQSYFTSNGSFVDENNNFQLGEYQDAVRSGSAPVLDDFWMNWQLSLQNWLPGRKLQDVFSRVASVTEAQVLNDYLNNNQSCEVNYAYVLTRDIADSLIDLSENEITARYEEEKEDKYKTYTTRVLEYVKWTTDFADLDSAVHEFVRDSIMDITYNVLDEAQLSGLGMAAALGENIELDTLHLTLEYDNNSGLPFNMGGNRRIVRFAFDNEVGELSEILSIDEGHIICQIIDEKPASYKPIDDVRNGIESTLKREKRNDLAKQVLETAIDSGVDIASLPEQNEMIKYKAGEAGTPGGSFPDIGRSSSLAGTIRGMEAAEISGIVETFSSVMVVELLSKSEIDSVHYAEQKQAIRDRLLSGEQSSMYYDWVNNSRDSKDILDYRSKIY